jgi:tetratricopeptide (TPR) repeat protein
VAFTHFQAGALDDAWAAYLSVYDADSSNVPALVGLGRISRRRGELSTALRYLEAATSIDPGRLALLCDKATILRDMSRFDEARNVLMAVLTRDPNNLDALLGLGLLARRGGDHEEALAYFKRGLTRQTDHPGLQSEVAETLRLLDRFDEAEQLYKRAAEANPRAAAPIHGLSLIAQARGEFESAIVLAKEASELEPDRVSHWVHLSGRYRDAGRVGEAEALIDRGLIARPDHSGLWIEKGILLRTRNEHALALAAFEHAEVLDSGRGLVEIAQEHRALGHPDQARAAYRRALERSPTNISAILGMAELEMIAARYDRCIEYCDELIATHPSRVGAYRLKCRALIQLDRAEEAVRIVSEFAANGRISAEADAAGLEILRICGRRGEAEALLSLPRVATTKVFGLWFEGVLTRMAFFDLSGAEAALSDPPARCPYEHSRVLYAQGLLADLQWRVEDAVTSFERALELRSDDPATHHHLARLHFLRTDVDAAYHHLRTMMYQRSSALSLRGESRNVSQNLVGQLLNELRLDDEVRSKLVAVRHEDLPRRIDLLLEIVKSSPGLTPPAIYLVLALRQLAVFQPAPSTTETSASPLIPRKIVQFWDQKQPPPEIVRLLRTWEEAHPGYQYSRFDNSAARDYLATHYPDVVLNAYRSAAHPAQASDLFRLAYLYREGGYYADADDQCVGNVSSVTPPDVVLIAHQEHLATLGNNFLGCVPGEPVIGRALTLAIETLTHGYNDNIWLATGPGLLTRAFAEVLVGQKETWRDWLRPRRILDRRDLAQVSRPHSIVHYKNTRRGWLRSAFKSRVLVSTDT